MGSAKLMRSSGTLIAGEGRREEKGQGNFKKCKDKVPSLKGG